MFDIWVETLIISLLFFVSYVTVKIVFYYRYKNQASELVEPQPINLEQTIPKEDSAMKTIKPFISKNTSEGYKPQVIKDALLKQGWSKEKIDQAFKELNL